MFWIDHAFARGLAHPHPRTGRIRERAGEAANVRIRRVERARDEIPVPIGPGGHRRLEATHAGLREVALRVEHPAALRRWELRHERAHKRAIVLAVDRRAVRDRLERVRRDQLRVRRCLFGRVHAKAGGGIRRMRERCALVRRKLCLPASDKHRLINARRIEPLALEPFSIFLAAPGLICLGDRQHAPVTGLDHIVGTDDRRSGIGFRRWPEPLRLKPSEHLIDLIPRRRRLARPRLQFLWIGSVYVEIRCHAT